MDPQGLHLRPKLNCFLARDRMFPTQNVEKLIKRLSSELGQGFNFEAWKIIIENARQHMQAINQEVPNCSRDLVESKNRSTGPKGERLSCKEPPTMLSGLIAKNAVP